MGRFPKCKYCGVDITNKSNATKKSNGYYHNDCLIKEEEERNLNKTDWQKLLDTINDIYDGNCNFPFICKQLKTLKQENEGWKDSGINYTLWYYVNILECKFNPEFGIQWILSKYYEEAKRFYIKQIELKKKSKEIDLDIDKNKLTMKGGKGDWKKDKFKEIDFD